MWHRVNHEVSRRIGQGNQGMGYVMFILCSCVCVFSPSICPFYIPLLYRHSCNYTLYILLFIFFFASRYTTPALYFGERYYTIVILLFGWAPLDTIRQISIYLCTTRYHYYITASQTKRYGKYPPILPLFSIYVLRLYPPIYPYPPPSPFPGVRGVQATQAFGGKKPNPTRSERGQKAPPGMGYIISIPPPGPPLKPPFYPYFRVLKQG